MGLPLVVVTLAFCIGLLSFSFVGFAFSKGFPLWFSFATFAFALLHLSPESSDVHWIVGNGGRRLLFGKLSGLAVVDDDSSDLWIGGVETRGQLEVSLNLGRRVRH